MTIPTSQTTALFIVPLREADSKTLVGGKAAALGAMIRHGLPVPDGFVVTVTSAAEHAERSFANLPSNADASARARSICETPLSEEFEASFTKAFSKLIRHAAAIRSSATAEDSSNASFAGQYDSFLNVTSAAEAIEKLKLCWASLWSEHAQGYAAQHRMLEIEMAVVVQEMAPADVAGVAFSAEPVTGKLDILYVEAVLGLGEALVSGERDPELKVWLDRNAQTKRADFSTPGDFPLSIHSLPDLATHVLSIETLFGQPVDVEWTWAKKTSYCIVQARPITVLHTQQQIPPVPHWFLPGRPERGWTKDSHSLFDLWDEYNAEAIRPLDWDLFQCAVWEANLQMFDFIEAAPHVENIAVLVDGVVVAIDPAGRCATNSQVPPTRISTGHIDDWDETVQSWERELQTLEASASGGATLAPEDIIQLVNECAAAYRNACCLRLANMMQWIDGIGNCEEDIQRLLTKCAPESEGTVIMTDLQSGIPHETAAMNTALAVLLREAHDRPECLGETSFQGRVEDFIGRYGHFEIADEPFANHPELIWEQLRKARSTQGGDVYREDTAHSRFTARLASLRDMLDHCDSRNLEKSVQTLRKWISIRETTKTKQNIFRPLLLRLVQKAGIILAGKQEIDEWAHVNLLSWSEVCASLRTESGSLNHRQIVARRQAILDWKRHHTWIPTDFLEQEASPDKDFFLGEPGSPGMAEGIARVVLDVSDFAKVEQGEIVVAYRTNPAWTQLFSRISAIVVEHGGNISHAAVTAREYGIPAILAVRGITKAISSGDRLSVNGSEGEIHRIRDQGPEAEHRHNENLFPK